MNQIDTKLSADHVEALEYAAAQMCLLCCKGEIYLAGHGHHYYADGSPLGACSATPTRERLIRHQEESA